MVKRLTQRHDDCPETHICNNSCKTIDGLWTTPDVVPIQCGYLDYLEDWDHRMVWANFDEKLLFGHREAKAVPVAARKCLLKQVSVNECGG